MQRNHWQGTWVIPCLDGVVLELLADKSIYDTVVESTRGKGR